LTGYGQERGQIGLQLVAREAMNVTISEVWPWWLRTFMHRLELLTSNTTGEEARVIDLSYTPSIPRKRPTTVHLKLSLPAHSITRLSIPYEAAYLRYTEYPSDAHRGFELPSSTIFYNDSSDGGKQKRLSTESALLELPTPDFSMPYNVIIMSSTVMAVFFGLMQGTLTRRWTFVKVAPETGTGQVTK
jgi:phosphatidylinositol glycan class T